jgi:hypothetical protein
VCVKVWKCTETSAYASIMESSAIAPLVLVAAATLTAGCASSPKERLEGRWIGEAVESFHPTNTKRALGWAKGTHFTFKGSQVTVSIPAESARRGTFKIAQASADELRLKFMRTTGAVDEATFRFEGEDKLRWQLGDGRSILLRKAVD